MKTPRQAGTLLHCYLILMFLSQSVLVSADCPAPYSIVAGDGCWAIANSHGLTLDALKTFNPGLNCDTIQPGQIICLQQATTTTAGSALSGSGTSSHAASGSSNSGSSCPAPYTIVAGDGCWTIANSHGLTVENLQTFNPELNCNTIQPGQVLCLQQASGFSTGSGSKDSVANSTTGTMQTSTEATAVNGTCATVLVQPGDSCSKIADAKKITTADIEKFNKGNTWQYTDCAGLQAGARICVSVGASPLPDIVPGTQCGPQSQGNKTCPLNACCSQFGFCGTTNEFCAINPQRIPGLGCLANCGTQAPAQTKQCANTMQITVGYFEGWADERPCMQFKPANINPNAFTHMHYAFGVVTAAFGLEVNQAKMQQMRDVVALKQKNPRLKAILSVGGWAFNNNGPTGTLFSDMVASPATRKAFIESSLAFMKNNGLDGIDIDWEYPGKAERNGKPEDGDNFVALVHEMKAAFGTKYSVSATIPAGYYFLSEFKIAEMAASLDYIVAMEYDLAGNWDFEAGRGAIQAHTNITMVETSLNMIRKAGVQSNKLVMGVAYYGRSFKLADPRCNRPGCQFVNPGGVDPTTDSYAITADPGKFTTTGGFLAYGEIANMIQQNGITPQDDPNSFTKFFSYGKDSWVAYDDPSTMMKRIQFGKDRCLGGVAAWAIDLDSEDQALTKVLAANVGSGAPAPTVNLHIVPGPSANGTNYAVTSSGNAAAKPGSKYAVGTLASHAISPSQITMTVAIPNSAPQQQQTPGSTGTDRVYFSAAATAKNITYAGHQSPGVGAGIYGKVKGANESSRDTGASDDFQPASISRDTTATGSAEPATTTCSRRPAQLYS